MTDDPVMVILGGIGTLVVIVLTLKMTGLTNPDVIFKFPKDLFPISFIIAIMVCVWWSLPYAWFRGLLFDPVFCIIGAMIMTFAVITGCIESESAYRKRRDRRDR